MAGQHEQVLRVAAHAGGQVVHGDQARPAAGVRLGLAELADEPELVLHQGLAATGQLGEHLAELPAQPGLVVGQPQHLALHLVEGARHIADLVESGNADGLDGERPALAVRAVDVPQADIAERVGQPHLGQLDRPGPQLVQRPRHRPDQDHRGPQAYGQDDGREDQGQDGRHDGPVVHGTHV